MWPLLLRSREKSSPSIAFLWLILFLRSLCLCPCQMISTLLSHHCKESCGSLSVGYPFGISSACGHPYFHLICSHNSTLLLPLGLHKLRVLNFTAESIIIDPITAKCDDPNTNLFDFSITTIFSISPRNYLVMFSCKNITTCLNACSFRGYTFPKNACNLSADCCYDLRIAPQEFNLSSVDCSSFASWVTDYNPLGIQTQLTVHVEYGMELNWAIPGDCSQAGCQKNAECVDSSALLGYNCLCQEGFEGDPYVNGSGCHPVLCDSETIVGCFCPNGMKMGTDGCKSTENKAAKRDLLIAGILAGSTILSGVIIALALLKRRIAVLNERRSGVDMKQLVQLLSSNGSASNVTMFSYKDLDRATKGFSSSEILGHGAYGTVYAGKLQDQTPVAVKRINNVSPHGVEQVLNEVMVLSTVRHPNLVVLYGCCLEFKDPLIVYEFVPNGTLAQHLQQERGKGLDWYTRITIATEAAQGLAYLHSEVNPPIYHRDVKSSNILLDFKYNTKVADFGLSKLVLTEGSHISTVPQGTPGYLDPEYHQNFHLSDKSDVYSFGVVLIEIMTAMKVVDFSREQREVNLAALALSKIASGTLHEIIDPFLDASSHPLVLSLVQRVAELAFRCLSYDKDARPTMVEVVEDLEQIRVASSALASVSRLEYDGLQLGYKRMILPR